MLLIIWKLIYIKTNTFIKNFVIACILVHTLQGAFLGWKHFIYFINIYYLSWNIQCKMVYKFQKDNKNNTLKLLKAHFKSIKNFSLEQLSLYTFEKHAKPKPTEFLRWGKSTARLHNRNGIPVVREVRSWAPQQKTEGILLVEANVTSIIYGTQRKASPDEHKSRGDDAAYELVPPSK